MKKRTVAVVMAAAMTIGMMVTGVSVQAGVEDKTLIVGFDAEYPPFGYKDDNGEYVGFDLDLAQEVCDNLGWELVKKPINWDSKDMELNSGTIDCIWNGFTINGREDDYTWSDPYINNEQVIVVAKDSEIEKLADLKGKKAAQSLTSNFGKLAQAAGAELVATDGFNQSVELVLSGRADATINDSISFLDFKKHKPDAPLKIAATQDNADHAAVLLAKGQPELLAAINEALASAQQDGTYLQISHKYFGADVSK